MEMKWCTGTIFVKKSAMLWLPGFHVVLNWPSAIRSLSQWKPGNHNIADFFTKIVPVHHFISMVPVFNAIRVRVPHPTAYHARIPTKRHVHFQAWDTTIISN
jgi:hypothetical protein